MINEDSHELEGEPSSDLQAAAGDDEYTVSDTEKLSIAETLLMRSPPGQFSLVLDDIKKLLPAGLMTSEKSAAIANTYNMSVARVARGEGGRSFVIAKEGQLEGEGNGSQFIDSAVAKAVSVDNISGSILSESEESDVPAGPLEEERAAVETSLATYIKGNFAAAPTRACAVYAPSGSPNTLVIYVSAEHINLRNWWAGSWVGRYEVTGLGGGNPSFSGSITVRGHYFESGNLQLQSNKTLTTVDIDIDSSDASDLAKAIVTKIRDAEDGLQNALNDMYTEMSNTTLRNMRRAVTVTGEKFSWKIAQIRMRNTLVTSKKG